MTHIAQQSFATDLDHIKFAMSAAGIGIWELDIATNKVIWDDKCRALFGVAADNVIPYEEAIKFIHPDDVAGVDNAVQAAIAGVDNGKYDVTYRTIGADDGKLRWVNFSGNAYFDEEGNLQRFGGIAQDVTALRLSAEKYRSLFENVDQGFCILQMIFDENNNPVDYRFLEVNPVFSSQTGLIDPVGKTAKELVPGLEQHWFQIYGNVALTGKPHRFTEGSEKMGRWFEVYAFPIGDTQDRNVALLFTDISERKKTEIALKESEAFNRNALESSPDCVKILDTDGRLTYMNTNGMCLMEIDNFDTVKNQPWPNLWGEENKPIVSQALQDATKGLPGRFTAYCSTAKGTPKWWDVMVSPVLDENNKVSQIISVSRDVSESREAKQQLEENRLLLQQRVEERTAELAEANKNLKRSNEELAQYAYVASHDLQEPLRKIQVFATMLKNDKQISERSNDIIRKISSSSERMGILLQDLLHFSRLLNSDKAYEVVNIDRVAKAAIADLDLIIKEKGATISVDNLPMIEAIKHQTGQLFYNLIGNALKFSKEGVPPVIDISAEMLDKTEAAKYLLHPAPNAMYHRICVKDNGIGFEQEYSDQIFEVFKRLHNRDAYAGSGIGLALCKRIADNHGGVLYTESEVGKGATFCIILPDRQLH